MGRAEECWFGETEQESDVTSVLRQKKLEACTWESSPFILTSGIQLKTEEPVDTPQANKYEQQFFGRGVFQSMDRCVESEAATSDFGAVHGLFDDAVFDSNSPSTPSFESEFGNVDLFVQWEQADPFWPGWVPGAQ
eukprot:CAMPEP_0113707072 /NCGR_PEP_ID=MMETSP0038_2-20120614/28141_1 /TAXON_ID=2898 /ORGANISM="Cryptomonas paramecium" /LENGTH=135 /DNA_ID=CAMNT_0000632463 /DNA_START=203 /DNA_END=610 /DNA_ORIENTATION=+ /assembly_acc=CAM_ASM_000170